MTVYSIVLLVLLFLFLAEQGGLKKNSRILFSVSAFLVFFIMAFRGEDVGGDMIEYVHFWQGKDDMYGTFDKPTESLLYEPGLSWLCYFLHLFNDGDAWFFIFWTSFITIVPFLYLVWRDSYYKVLPVLLYMVLWGLLDISYTGLRQVIGASLCLTAYIVWTTPIRKKWIKHIVVLFLIAFSLSFHASVYFCVLMFFCLKVFKNKRKTIHISILLITLVLGMLFSKIAPATFEKVNSIFTSFDLLFRYNHYFEGTGEADGLQEAVIGAKQILSTLVVCLIIFLSSDEKCNKFYINCLVFGCSLYNMFMSFPNAGRFLFPYMIVGLITMLATDRINKYKLYRLVLVLLVIILSVHQIRTWELGFEDKNSSFYVFNQMFPYKFIWE